MHNESREKIDDDHQQDTTVGVQARAAARDMTLPGGNSTTSAS